VSRPATNCAGLDLAQTVTPGRPLKQALRSGRDEVAAESRLASPARRANVMRASNSTLLEALRSTPIAAELSPEQGAVLAGLMQLRACEPRQVLGREGEVDDRLVIVVDGALAVIRHIDMPDETLLTALRPGDFAHELGFLDGTPRFASLMATEPTRVLELKRGALESLIDTHPRILYAVMLAIARAVHRVQTRLSVQATELVNYVVKQHGRY
jgi:CRP/FNR family cyclic AMP-dependent transcriptional regulator